MLKCKYLLLITIYFIPTFGTVYYVDGTNGSDKFDGLTEKKPWKTIGYANRLLQAGDIVYIKSGKYADFIKPVSSGDSAKPIIYSRFNNDIVIIENAKYGIIFENVNYITVKNIYFNNIDFYLLIWKQSCHNTIDSCTFNKMRSFVNWAGCRILDNSKYNKIVNSSISHYGIYDSLAKGAVLDIGTESSKTDSSFYNLVENCTLYHGGHHVLGLYSKYNVIKYNYFHNEGWNNGFGERNIILNGHDEISGFNLIEGNKIAFSGLPPNNSGGSGMALVTKNNIIRKNIFFYCNSAGLILGTTSNYNNNPCNNKIYNNTFIKNGYNTNIKTGLETKCGIGFADYESNKSITGNSIINNLFHNNGKNKAFGFYKVDSSLQYFKGNWVESGDPLFENSLSLLSPDNQLPNFELKDSSPCIDKGVFLTRIISEDGFGKSFQVKDAGFFSNGFKVTCSDTIQLEKNKTTFVIKSINYKTREIIIDKNVSWSKNQGVFLVYKGSFPDIGACEHFTNLVTPNKNNIKIKFKKQKIKHYSVYDISGRKIKKLALNRYSKFDLVTSHKLSYCLPVSNIYIHVFKSNSQIHADLFSTIK